MTNGVLTSLLCFCCVWLLVPVAAQDFSFRRYQVENGVSNNQIRCIVQDKKGFIWCGTPDGLNRFDGYAFKVFANNNSNNPAVSNNSVRALCADAHNQLWVGTEHGLFHFNPETEKFRLVPVDSLEVVSAIQTDSRGMLWFISGVTLYKLHIATGAITRYPPHQYFRASALCFLGNQLWVATTGGVLMQYRNDADAFNSFPLFTGAAKADKNKWIDQLYAAANGDVLIGTATHGAFIFDTSRLLFRQIPAYNDDGTSLFVKAFVQDADNEYWLGTESSGLYLYNAVTGRVRHAGKRYNDPYALSDNSVNSLCRDNEGGIWVGTNYGGINYYSAQYDVFKKYYPRQGENALSGNIIREIHGDNRGNLWIGTEDAGLNKMELATGRFTHYQPNGSAASISYKGIRGMLVEGNDLWVGTYVHGLDIMDITTGGIKQHYGVGADSSSLQSDIVTCLYRAADSSLYVATARGVYTFDRTRKTFLQVKQLPLIWYTSLYKDSAGILWAGTLTSGAWAVNTHTGTVEHFTHVFNQAGSIGKGQVSCIVEDSRGRIWIGTDGGLCYFNRQSRQFSCYSTAEGWPSGFVMSILEDDLQRLWVSTSHGLVCFNPDSGRCLVYKMGNGLLSDQFNYNSAYKDAAGNMYFGSMQGLIRFHPAALHRTTGTAPLYITGFQVANQELPIGGGQSSLLKSITFTDEIELKYSQSSFSIDFAELRYTAPEATAYAYRMEGLDKEWTWLKNNRKVYFTNLAPGTYRFRAKALAGAEQGRAPERMLTIRILPPWWRSTLACLVYGLVSLAAAVLLVKAYNRRLRQRNRRRQEQQELVRTRALYEDKLNFFTNVAHEIKTPLTLIKGPMESVMKAAEEMPDVADHLKIMDRNTDKLVALTQQLLDFRQTEIKGFSLNRVLVNVSELLQEAWEAFKPLAASRRLQYTLEMPDEPVFAAVDAEAFYKIATNLFSNAVKYGETRVIARFIIEETEAKQLVLTVSNDGFQIPAEMAERIFEPFVRLPETRKRAGTGIGLALALSLARLHEGTIECIQATAGMNTFELRIPMDTTAL